MFFLSDIFLFMSNMSELMAVMRIDLNEKLLKRDERLDLNICKCSCLCKVSRAELNQNACRIREVLRGQSKQFSWLEATVQVSTPCPDDVFR